MRCYYHPETEAVGMCSQCGRAACHRCIEEIEGSLLCKDCIARNTRLLAMDQIWAGKKAKKRIIWSWIVTAAVSIMLIRFIFYVMQEQEVYIPPPWKIWVSLFFIYTSWSTYWGWVTIWPWWRRLMNKSGCVLFGTPVFWLATILTLAHITFVCSVVYGCLGGGIYQYIKHRRIRRSA